MKDNYQIESITDEQVNRYLLSVCDYLQRMVVGTVDYILEPSDPLDVISYRVRIFRKDDGDDPEYSIRLYNRTDILQSIYDLIPAKETAIDIANNYRSNMMNKLFTSTGEKILREKFG